MRMPRFAPRDAQQAAVVHVVEQMRRRARRAAPVVRHRAVGEVRVHFARVHGAALADELEQRLRPSSGAPVGPARLLRARMHQRVHGRVTKP